MKKKRSLLVLLLLVLVLWSAASVAEAIASVPSEQVTAEYITWEVLQSPAGQVAVIIMLTQGLKYLFDQFTSLHTKYIVYGLALVFQIVLLFVPEYALTVQAGILAVINGFVIANAAMKTFEDVFQKNEPATGAS